MSNTGKGALAGGAIGAGTGALIGQASGGKAGPGAVIGGAIGALAGGAIGNEEDRREREALHNRIQQAEASRNRLGINEVVQLAKDGHSDDVIINQIRTTRSTYDLSTEDLGTLRANGVSDVVIKEMQLNRPDAYRRPRYVHGPPPVIYGPPPPVVIVHPVPPPRPVVGVGFHVH
jgi:hypothetical protein